MSSNPDGLARSPPGWPEPHRAALDSGYFIVATAREKPDFLRWAVVILKAIAYGIQRDWGNFVGNRRRGWQNSAPAGTAQARLTIVQGW